MPKNNKNNRKNKNNNFKNKKKIKKKNIMPKTNKNKRKYKNNIIDNNNLTNNSKYITNNLENNDLLYVKTNNNLNKDNYMSELLVYSDELETQKTRANKEYLNIVDDYFMLDTNDTYLTYDDGDRLII